MNTKTKNTKGAVVIASVGTETVGQCFGTAGVVRIRGREVFRTGTYGYGNHGGAEREALAWCAARLASTGGAY